MLHEHCITKVYGTANGFDVVFRHKKGDIWEASVPRADDGVYECELWAENDAGNSAYLDKVLYAVTGHELRIKAVPGGYHAVDIKKRRRRCGYELCDRETC